MNQPTMFDVARPAPDTDAFMAYMPVPGMGVLPVNAFLIHAAEPVLVDAGLPALAGPFLEQLWSRMDPEDLRWLWVTHCDADHLGALDAVLEAAPEARIVTNYLGMGKLLMQRAIAPERFYLVNPGQALDVGDRELVAMVPPVYDAPETMGLVDRRTGTLFSSDCFGALLSEPELEATALAPDALREGLVSWSSVDAPWLSRLSASAMGEALRSVRDADPEVVLSAHLPPARKMTEQLCRDLDAARHAPPFVGPDQAALMAA